MPNFFREKIGEACDELAAHLKQRPDYAELRPAPHAMLAMRRARDLVTLGANADRMDELVEALHEALDAVARIVDDQPPVRS